MCKFARHDLNYMGDNIYGRELTVHFTHAHTVRVENFEGVLISRFSWVANDTKIIQVEGRITTREIF